MTRELSKSVKVHKPLCFSPKRIDFCYLEPILSDLAGK